MSTPDSYPTPVRRLPAFRRAGVACAIAVSLAALSTSAFAAGGHGNRVHISSNPQATDAENSREMANGRAPFEGATLAQLTQQFWRWLYSIPVGVDPASETSGANCAINQSGNVWFLAGPATTMGFTTNCTIPAGKIIVAAVFTYVNDYPCPDPTFKPAPGQSLESYLLDGVAPLLDAVTQASGTLDGHPVPAPRVKTKLFPFTGAASWAAFNDPCVTGSPELGVSDGFFVFLRPLSRGTHTLELHSVSPAGAASGTFRLTVQ